jgi:hypothetical protein
VFLVRYEHHLHIKSKAIVVTCRGETLGVPHCLDNRLIYDGQEVSLTYRPRSTIQKLFVCLWYAFLLEGE